MNVRVNSSNNKGDVLKLDITGVTGKPPLGAAIQVWGQTIGSVVAVDGETVTVEIRRG